MVKMFSPPKGICYSINMLTSPHQPFNGTASGSLGGQVTVELNIESKRRSFEFILGVLLDIVFHPGDYYMKNGMTTSEGVSLTIEHRGSIPRITSGANLCPLKALVNLVQALFLCNF